MVQAIVSPEEVRRFAAELKRFNENLKQEQQRIRGRLQSLGETWRDQEHKRFEQEFEQAVKVINHFLESSERYVPFLIRKAESAERYLNQR